MRETLHRFGVTLLAGVAVIAVLAMVACSADSPTAPVQEPAPPPGSGGASAIWRINVSADPGELPAGDPNPGIVSIDVRRADNGQRPPTGTTIVLSSSLVNFGDANGDGVADTSAVISLAGGRGSAYFFAGTLEGTAFIQAQLETSVGQTSIRVFVSCEDLVASFVTSNPENDLSVLFINRTEGDADAYEWSFGDGGTSRQESPSHIYAAAGEYSVVLTAFKGGRCQSRSEAVTVTVEGTTSEGPPNAGFTFTVSGLTVAFSNTSTTSDPENVKYSWSFGDGSAASTEAHPVYTYAAAGTYTVTLSVSDSFGADVTSRDVTVN